MKLMASALATLALLSSCEHWWRHDPEVQLGPRPFYLVDRLPEGALKTRLEACKSGPFHATQFSMSHRGAPLQFPEHSAEGFLAALRMGAGVVECDVTFTADNQLICRHAQDDLHRTTNILDTELAQTCVRPFTAGTRTSFSDGYCRASDITLEQFLTLIPRMDGHNRAATTPDRYPRRAGEWRTQLYAQDGLTPLSHAGHIALLRDTGVIFAPEFKPAVVPLPHKGLEKADFAARLIADYVAAEIPPERVRPQSFDPEVLAHWRQGFPEYGANATLLTRPAEGFDPQDPATWAEDFAALKADGVNRLGPALPMLLTLEEGRLAPSAYGLAARAAGLELVTWSLERSADITQGGYYFDPVAQALEADGQVFEVIDLLVQSLGVTGIFSDWPATTSYYASCMGLD